LLILGHPESSAAVHGQFLTSACTVKVLLHPGPCIHYISSLTDPAFTISGFAQYTEHGSAIILVNINC
ncbi:unnamed protein product, partial [Staurois parvus]